MTQLPPYATPGQAADWLTEQGARTIEDTVRRWCREGKVPSIKTPGGKYLIRREDILAILDLSASAA
jgi:excisionase family DNA binding protein